MNLVRDGFVNVFSHLSGHIKIHIRIFIFIRYLHVLIENSV